MGLQKTPRIGQKVERACGAAALGLCLGFLHTDAGRIWERRTLDTRFEWRGARQTKARIVIVAADDATEKAWMEPTLFWGARYGRVLQNLHEAGAKEIAVDVVPAVDVDAYLGRLGVSEDVRPDTELARALLEGEGRVVLAYLLNDGGSSVYPVARFTSLPEVSGSLGFVDLLPDPDGIVRAMPYFAADAEDRAAGRVRPALATLAAARFRKPGGSATTDGALFSQTPLQKEAAGGIWARYLVNWTGQEFPVISAGRVEQNTLSASERAQLKDALVFVGLTASFSNDRYRTPSAGVTAGVSLHAEGAATLLDGCALRVLGDGAGTWLCAGLGISVLLAGVLLPSRFRLLLTVLAGGIAVAVAQIAFVRYLVLPMGGMMLCLLLPSAVQQAAQALEERVRRQHLKDLLGRSVSPQVRDYLMESPERLKLSGTEREAVILFFDIRGSLTFAESRTPTETLRELNDFFARLVPVLETHGGLLYRYTGDGFLAVFGAPDPLPNAQAQAVAACVDLVDAVRAVNAERAKNGKAPLPVGCGLHSGPVICGNLGVAERSDFTVIGDVVNRAARLESCNKALKSEIVVSRAVWDALPEPKPAGFIGPETVAIAGSARGEVVFFAPTPLPLAALVP